MGAATVQQRRKRQCGKTSVEQNDDRNQLFFACALRHHTHGLDLGEEPIASNLLLMDELRVGERGYLHGDSSKIEGVIVPVRHAKRGWPAIKSAVL